MGTRAIAAEPKFTAQVDRNQISLDDTVSLKLSVQSDSTTMTGEAMMKAPDFEVVNEFSSISMSSQYDSTVGHFSTLNHQQITKILRPLKTGTLKISEIHLNLGGKSLSAPDISIQVSSNGSPSGSSNSSPRGSSSGSPSGSSNSLSGGGSPPRNEEPRLKLSDKAKNGRPSIFVKAEVSKEKAYKGEQVIVSYYLYHRGRVFNIQIDKFPVLSAFLREDLEIPVMNQRLDTEVVELNGTPYERSLLARYAAYPLQEGKLEIDPMSLKFNYYSNNRGGKLGLDEDDPFFGFFQQLAPRVGSSRSDQVSIEVLPLPEQGRPASFGGGIGDFQLSSAIDKYEVRANEAVNFTVKVEGRGNISNIQEPKTKWPDDLELYDSKGKTQMGHGGDGTKVFEFLLIPRVPGKLNLPSLEFSFFDPVKKVYYTKSTDPIQLTVLNPAPGSALVSPRPKQDQSAPDSPSITKSPKTSEVPSVPAVKDLRYLKAPGDFSSGFRGLSIWRGLVALCVMSFSFLLYLVGSNLFKQKKASAANNTTSKIRRNTKNWEKLQSVARDAPRGLPWQEISVAYETLTDELFNALEDVFQIGVRSMSRFEMERTLVGERGLDASTWGRIIKLLEFSDLVQFASSVGGTSEASARSELARWVQEGETLLLCLEKHKFSV